MALPLSVDFETSYSDEGTIGTTGGDGDSFQSPPSYTNGSTTVQADSDVAPPDTVYSFSMRFDQAATTATAGRGWDAAIGTVDNVYATFAFYRANAISTNHIFAQMQATNGSATRAQLRYNSTNNTISIRRQFTVWDTTTETISEDTWYYLQWHVYGNTSGTGELKLYDADQTLLETINNSSQTGNFGGQIGRFEIGQLASPTANSIIHYSGIELSGTGYPDLPALPSTGFTGWGVPILG